jgi:hypothetical protein
MKNSFFSENLRLAMGNAANLVVFTRKNKDKLKTFPPTIFSGSRCSGKSHVLLEIEDRLRARAELTLPIVRLPLQGSLLNHIVLSIAEFQPSYEFIISCAHSQRKPTEKDPAQAFRDVLKALNERIPSFNQACFILIDDIHRLSHKELTVLLDEIVNASHHFGRLKFVLSGVCVKENKRIPNSNEETFLNVYLDTTHPRTALDKKSVTSAIRAANARSNRISEALLRRAIYDASKSAIRFAGWLQFLYPVLSNSKNNLTATSFEDARMHVSTLIRNEILAPALAEAPRAAGALLPVLYLRGEHGLTAGEISEALGRNSKKEKAQTHSQLQTLRGLGLAVQVGKTFYVGFPELKEFFATN